MLARIRDFFRQREVLEVDTPAISSAVSTDPHLQPMQSFPEAGVASQPMYLQPSPEFAMKRLLAAGSGSIYQICKAFRHGEAGRYHNPEFTMLEWYRPGFDMTALMLEVDHLIREAMGSQRSLKDSAFFQYQAIFQMYCGMDPLSASLRDFAAVATEAGITHAAEMCGEDRSLWLDLLFSHLVQPHLGKDGLCFVSHFPAAQAALARLDPAAPEVALRFEVYCHGVELANGFHELLDPVEQRQRFIQEQQQLARQGINRELDQHLLDALAHGLPDCAGVALGVDRLLMLLVDADHLQDVLAFPADRA